MRRMFACVSLLVVAVACSSQSTSGPNTETETYRAGDDQVTLVVPPGALSDDQAITVTASEEPAPAGYVAVSRVYRFDPDGLVFASPVEVRFVHAGDANGLSIFWSSGEGFQELPTYLVNGAMVASVTHFSRGFLGRR